MKGLVVKNTGSWYTVLTDDGQLIESKVKGNFRLKGIRSTNPVAVGDRVELVANAEGTAFITAIEDRRNYIIRRSQNLSKQSHIIAANVDQAFLVVTVDFPQTSTTFIDRFLASAEAYRVPVVLVFNKTDLLDADLLRYQQMMMAEHRLSLRRHLRRDRGGRRGTPSVAAAEDYPAQWEQRCGEIHPDQPSCARR